MSIVRVVWHDAVGQWPASWSTVDDIAAGLEETAVETVGHLVEGHGRPFVVVAVAKTGSDAHIGGVTFGGVMAIPAEMVTTIEVLD